MILNYHEINIESTSFEKLKIPISSLEFFDNHHWNHSLYPGDEFKGYLFEKQDFTL